MQGSIRAQARTAEARHHHHKRSDDGDRRAAEKEVEPGVKREMFRSSIGIWQSPATGEYSAPTVAALEHPEGKCREAYRSIAIWTLALMVRTLRVPAWKGL